jgi:hypothetical protein
MLGLILQSQRCPDGVALHEGNSPEFQYCSGDREDLRLEIRDLEDPVVVRFMNARDDQARAKFFSEYGLMDSHPVSLHPVTTRSRVLAWQDRFAQLLDYIRNNKPVEAAEAINNPIFFGWRPGDDPPWYWAPRLQVIGKKRPPQMFFECRDLVSFMVAEIATGITYDVRVQYCQHCHRIFLTGPLTGRRAHAKFDSDRCRAAAMRARQKGRL